MTHSNQMLYIRLRFGMVEWHCPQCAKWNLSHVSYKTGYLVRCKGHHRGNIYVLGHTLRPYRIKGKRPPWPPDSTRRLGPDRGSGLSAREDPNTRERPVGLLLGSSSFATVGRLKIVHRKGTRPSLGVCERGGVS